MKKRNGKETENNLKKGYSRQETQLNRQPRKFQKKYSLDIALCILCLCFRLLSSCNGMKNWQNRSLTFSVGLFIIYTQHSNKSIVRLLSHLALWKVKWTANQSISFIITGKWRWNNSLERLRITASIKKYPREVQFSLAFIVITTVQRRRRINRMQNYSVDIIPHFLVTS